jgi:hypothetical protein
MYVILLLIITVLLARVPVLQEPNQAACHCVFCKFRLVCESLGSDLRSII